MRNSTLQGIAVFLLLGLASSIYASSVLLVPTSDVSRLVDGDIISFDVMIDFSDAGGTLGGGLDIAFDPSAMGLVSVTSAGLNDPGFSRDPDVMAGLLQSWAVGEFNVLGSSGPELVGRVQFEVLSTMELHTLVTVAGTNGVAGPWVSGQDFITLLTPTYNHIVLSRNESLPFNAGLNDAWFFSVTSGQGFFITVFPKLGFVSLAWFTYDTELPLADAIANLGDAGHRWLTALGPIVGNQAIMDIDITSGGIFDTPTEITHTDPTGSDGTIIVTFHGCNSGTIKYNIPSINKQGIIPIARVANDNIALCETLVAQ